MLGLIGDTTAIDAEYIEAQDFVESVKRVQEPYKKANRKFHPDDTVITLPGGQKVKFWEDGRVYLGNQLEKQDAAAGATPYRRRKLAAGVRIRRQRQRPGDCGVQAPGKVTIQENETMLTSKQRAYLRSLAVNEDTILMMGKSGMSPELVKQADDALEKRELIKGRVLPESSPMTSREAAEELARQTSSDVVQVIGSRFVLYRKKKKDPKIVLPR